MITGIDPVNRKLIDAARDNPPQTKIAQICSLGDPGLIGISTCLVERGGGINQNPALGVPFWGVPIKQIVWRPISGSPYVWKLACEGS